MYSCANDVSMHPLAFPLRDRQIAEDRKTGSDVKRAIEKASAQARREGADVAYAAAVLERLVGLVPLIGQAVMGFVTIGSALGRLDNLLVGRLTVTPSIGRVLYLILAYLSADATTTDVRIAVATTAQRGR